MQNIAKIKCSLQSTNIHMHHHISVFNVFQLQIQLNYDVIQLYKCYKLNILFFIIDGMIQILMISCNILQKCNYILLYNQQMITYV